jgi:hypothetical protein
VDVLVKVAEDEDLVVVADGLALEEFLGFLERRLVLLNLVGLRVEYEAVGDPAVVPAKYQYLRVVHELEAAEGVAGRPLLVLINQRHELPLLILQRAWAAQETV